MKRISWLLLAALPVILFFSCQKEVASAASRNAQMLKDKEEENNGEDCGDKPLATAGFFNITYSPENPKAGDDVIVCISTDCGKLTAGSLSDGTTTFPGVVQDDGSVCITIENAQASGCGEGETSVYTATVGYSNGGSNKECDVVYCPKQVIEFAATSAGICIEVDPADCDETNPLTISGEVTNITSTATHSTITMVYTVESCDNVTGVRVQGGATAGGNQGVVTSGPNMYTWGTDGPGTETVGYPRAENNNVIFSWITDLTAYEPQKFTVTYTRSLVTSCLTDVSGQWSAKKAGLTDATSTAIQVCP